MKILIFGISNFIGFNIGNELIKKFNIIGTISNNLNKYDSLKKLRIKKLNKKIKILKCDFNHKIEIKNIIKNQLPDIVINVAGYTKNYSHKTFNKKKGYSINVNPLKTIIKSLNKISKKQILYFHIGSSWEYSQNIQLCNEKSNKKPKIPYGIQKLRATKILKKISNDKTKIIVLRIFNIFGDLDNKRKIFPYLINNLKNNKISTLSSGLQMRDYIHVSDLSNAIKQIIKNKKKLTNFEIFNICRGKPYSIKKISSKICKIFRKRNNLVNFDSKKNRDFENKIFFGSCSKIKRITGWKPTNFNKSLRLLLKK
jgi:nucleoside-diphosphate-sugar epimerase